MSRKTVLVTATVLALGAGVWLFARQLWQAFLRLHGH